MNELTATRSIMVVTAEIQMYKQQAGSAILEIGRRLSEAKELLSHGEWLPWLEREVEFSEGTAQRFMRLAREYSNPSPVTDLGMSKALLLLALPSEEREDFLEKPHEINGEEKSVSEMSKRELAQAIAERNAAQLQAETLKAELAAAQEQVTMAGQAAELAERDKQGYMDAAATAKNDLKAERQASEALKKQLKALEAAANQPLTAEVVPDEVTLARIRQEVAEEQASAVREAEERAAEFERKYQAAKNPEAAQVSFLFSEMQSLYTRLGTTLHAMDESQPQTAEKLRSVIAQQLSAWSGSIGGYDEQEEA